MAVLSDASQAQFFWSINISIGIQYYFETIYIKFGKCPGVFIQDRIHAILIKLWIFQLFPMMIFMFHSPEICKCISSVLFKKEKKHDWKVLNVHIICMTWYDMTWQLMTSTCSLIKEHETLYVWKTKSDLVASLYFDSQLCLSICRSNPWFVGW